MADSLPLRNLDILLVEDNDADAVLTGEALEETGLPHKLHRVRNGQEALDFLHALPTMVPPTRLGLVLLDLNLPKMDGREFLTHFHQKIEWREIPIVVLSTSGDEKDRSLGRALPVQEYLVKPIQFDDLVERMGSLKRYWHSAPDGTGEG